MREGKGASGESLLGACLGRKAWPHATVCEDGQLGHPSPDGHSLPIEAAASASSTHS